MRPDYCPIGGQPCQSLCDLPCTTPTQRKPLTDEEIWKSDSIMEANSGYGASFETLREIVRAIEAAHGIK
jgi:hypothetical protein